MKVYSTIKTISKINIFVSILFVAIFSFSIILQNNQVGADESENKVEQGTDIISFKSEADSVISMTACSQSFSGDSIESKRIYSGTSSEENRENMEPELKREENPLCYTLSNSNQFTTISIDSAIFKFLKDTQSIFTLTTEQNKKFLNLKGRYFLQIYQKNKLDFFDIKQIPDGTIINEKPATGHILELYKKDLIELVNNTINDKEDQFIDENGEFLDSYGSITKDEEGLVNKVSIYLIDEGYPNAINNDDSLWCKMNDLFYNHIQDFWIDNGVDFNDVHTLLEDHKELYDYQENFPKDADKVENDKISLEYPKIIDMGDMGPPPSPEISTPFKVTLKDSAALGISGKAYFKVFIKPKAKQEADLFTKIEETKGAEYENMLLTLKNGETEFSFDWSHIKKQLIFKIFTTESEADNTFTRWHYIEADTSFYNPDLPKDYFIHVMAYEEGSVDLFSELEADFTVSKKGIFADQTKADPNNIFTLSVPKDTPQNKDITVTFKVNAKEDANKIDKVSIYACDGDVACPDSAIKGTWIVKNDEMKDFIDTLPDDSPERQKYSSSFKNLAYNKDTKFVYDSAGLTAGKKTFMLRAYIKKDRTTPFDYVVNSQTMATTSVYVGSTPTIPNVVRARTSIGSGGSLFDELASDSAQGSSISGFREAVAKLGNINLTFIGVLAFFAIVAGGFMYMTSAGGDEQKMAKAKKTIVYAIVGIFVAYLAFNIIRISTSSISKFKLPAIDTVMELK